MTMISILEANFNPQQRSALDTIKAEFQKLSAKVDAAIQERDAFVASIGEAKYLQLLQIAFAVKTGAALRARDHGFI